MLTQIYAPLTTMSLSNLFTWFCLFMFCFKNSGLGYITVFSPVIFIIFFILFLTLDMPASLPPPYSYRKRLVDVFIDICLQISCVLILVCECVVCVMITKAKSSYFCNDTHLTLWWLCLKIFTVLCSASSALFLYSFLPVWSASEQQTPYPTKPSSDVLHLFSF